MRLKKGKNSTEFINKMAYTNTQNEKKEKITINRQIFRQLTSILKIILPGFCNLESFYILSIAGALVVHSMCDIWLITNLAAIESSIFIQSESLFYNVIGKRLHIIPLISLADCAMQLSIDELKLLFRTRLTKYLYSKYLSGITYYKMSSIDNRISTPDQFLIEDVNKFCNSLCDLYSNISKPLLDIILLIKVLSSDVGSTVPLFLIFYLIFAGFLLVRLRKPISMITMEEQKLEGEFRYINSRLITNSEEIAFYQGQGKEKSTIFTFFYRLLGHLRMSLHFNFAMGYIGTIIAKYWSSVCGYILISKPFLGPRLNHLSTTDRLETYYKNGRLLVILAESIGCVVLSTQELMRLAGYTVRITQLIEVLNDMSEKKSAISMTLNISTDIVSKGMSHLKPGAGTIIKQNNLIKFDKVPLVTPNGDVMIKELSFEVKSGVNVLVHGPNGCGKSSLFRILGELWPLFGGVLIKPPKTKLFYIPQRPYMTLGTLRDQVIYPDSLQDMKGKGISDKDLEYFLQLVHLNSILDREGGWDAIKDWIDILSGGEKQRIAMARLFYHRPQFAILDECTSAVSVDVEGSMYQYCKELGITLLTVSHRKSLWKYHEHSLFMDGNGSYEFKEIKENIGDNSLQV